MTLFSWLMGSRAGDPLILITSDDVLSEVRSAVGNLKMSLDKQQREEFSPNLLHNKIMNSQIVQ